MATRKKTTTKAQANKEVTSETSADSLVGSEISINLQKTTFFGVGDPAKIWLNPKNYWAPVQDDLAKEDLAAIKKGLEEGKIVKGKKYIPPVQRDESVLKEWQARFKNSNLKNKGNTQTKELLRDLRLLANKSLDRGWTAREIGEYCMLKESEGAKRKEVMTTLDVLIKTYAGPSQPWEQPEEEPGLVSQIENEKGSNKAESSDDLLGQVFS